MNLHLIQDTVFLNDFVDLLSEIGEMPKNHFYVYYSESKTKDQYKHLVKDKFSQTKVLSGEIDQLHLQTNNYKNIFIHYLGDQLLDFVTKVDPGVKIFWCTWGSDFYCPDQLFADVLFDKKSRETFEKESEDNIAQFLKSLPPPSSTRKVFYNILELFYPSCRLKRSKLYEKKRWDSYFEKKKKVLKRVDYIMNYGIEDFEFIKKKYEINPSGYFPFFYTMFDEKDENIGYSTLLTKYNVYPNDKKIFIGNCADLHNNHLDLIPLLHKLNKTYANVKFIFPLSYGPPKYMAFISEVLREKLGSSFIPLYDFIEKHEYYKILNTIDVMIMNHNINMGGTNLFKALYFGKKVYVKKNNPLVVHLKRNGVDFDFVEDINNLDSFFEPLCQDRILKNRKGVLSVFSREKAKNNIMAVLD